MPTILRVGPYRFFFYAGDKVEPPHVHIERDDKVAKFWLSPVKIQKSGRFSRAEILKLYRLTEQHQALLLEKWYEYFDN